VSYILKDVTGHVTTKLYVVTSSYMSYTKKRGTSVTKKGSARDVFTRARPSYSWAMKGAKIVDASVKAVETICFGYRFRSRLEARWAVFFTGLQIRWLYEHECFDVGGRWYLPDFYLPDFGVYAEVKPTLFTREEFALATACNAILLDGAPEVKGYSLGRGCGRCKLGAYACYYVGHNYNRVHFGQSAMHKRLWLLDGEDMEDCSNGWFQCAAEDARAVRFEDGTYHWNSD